MNSIPKPEKHSESLLDICHDTDSSSSDIIVTENQNIILQSISSSEEIDQDSDCSLSLLVGEEEDLSNDKQDWKPRTQGVEIIVAFPRDVNDSQEMSQEDFKENNQRSLVHREWTQAHSVSLPNEIKMVSVKTKMLTMPPSLLKKEESSRADCFVNLDFLLPRPCLEQITSKSVARDVFHFIKGQQRKSEDFSTSDVKYNRQRVEVYCGLTSQGQLIAVKQVALDTSDKLATKKEYQKLQEEVELLKALKHVNIVAYLGTCLEENIVSIFMEFVPGGSISSIINRFGPLPEMVFCKYTKQILQGVAYLHENCVVHRDIKGNNVMLMPTGIIKLIDFGCAKRLAWAGLNGTHSDMLKSMHGTPYWMAPEVINESGYGRKSDIWSIGCTVFEMATGKPPLASMDRMAAMFYIGAHRGLMPPLPEHFSKDAADFVHVCLTRDQHERPSASQLLKHSFLKRSH
ncbi:mitogen-activated protein kinase kinase kinase 19 isoform X4 [Suncus etruscus]|uniref:mitogen-activated protein kinase kinase kinase 19 isoform X4 n=1 Tax=Suncus etruscus TaxID=109475 RepID=UPI00211003D7|nr:mitogen-activated protein kinase kinase kinase 19 isoform X4 [Suncus etruscus]